MWQTCQVRFLLNYIHHSKQSLKKPFSVSYSVSQQFTFGNTIIFIAHKSRVFANECKSITSHGWKSTKFIHANRQSSCSTAAGKILNIHIETKSNQNISRNFLIQFTATVWYDTEPNFVIQFEFVAGNSTGITSSANRNTIASLPLSGKLIHIKTRKVLKLQIFL